MNETAYAQIAQSVEQETENLRVRGSIPRLGTKEKAVSCSYYVRQFFIAKKYELQNNTTYQFNIINS